jgi:hypothetical protein
LLEHVQVTDAIDRFLCEEGISNIFTEEHSAQTSTLVLSILYAWLYGVGFPVKIRSYECALPRMCWYHFIIEHDGFPESWMLMAVAAIGTRETEVTQNYVKLLCF